MRFFRFIATFAAGRSQALYMSENTNYPQWPGIVAIVAVSLAGAIVFFFAGFAVGRCGQHHQPPQHLAMMSGNNREQCGPRQGSGAGPMEMGRSEMRMGPQGLPFGPQRREGPGVDKKAENAPAETTPAAAVKK